MLFYLKSQDLPTRLSEGLLYIKLLCMSQDICLILKILLLARMESNVLGDVNIISNSNNVVITNIYFALTLCQALCLMFYVSSLVFTAVLPGGCVCQPLAPHSTDEPAGRSLTAPGDGGVRLEAVLP